MKHSVNGIMYSYELTGTGPSLLLLHGFTGSKKTWSPFISLWSKRFKLISIDIIGHGETDAPNEVEHYTMSSVANAIESILYTNGITKTNVLGYSMGGRLALYLAVRHSHLIDSVLLESASPGLATQDERVTRVKQDEALAERILNDGIETFVNGWERLPLFETQTSLPKSVKNRIRSERLSQKPLGLSNSLKGMGTGAQPSLWKSLSQCQKQVTLVVGSLDQKFVNLANLMEKQLPNCQKVVVEGTGHAVHVESPDIFGKIVYDDFCRI